MWAGTWGSDRFALQWIDDTGVLVRGNSFTLHVLKPAGSTDQWTEFDAGGKPIGTVSLVCGANELRGQTLDRHALPISAAQTEDDAFVGFVGGEAPPKVFRIAHRTIQVAWLKSLPNISTIRIQEPSPAEATINVALENAYRGAVSHHVECQVLQRHAGAGGRWFFDWTVAVEFWRGPLLALYSSGWGYCGQAHPDGENEQWLFDTRSGEAVRTLNWLLPEYRNGIARTSLLGKRVRQLLLRDKRSINALPSEERECASLALEWHAPMLTRVTPSGMAFAYPFNYARRSCHRELLLRWRQARQFLSPEGLDWLKHLQNSAPS